MLDASPERLDAFESNHPTDVENCCRDVFKEWLDRNGTERYPVTWKSLCELLQDLDLSKLGDDLHYIINDPNNSFI